MQHSTPNWVASVFPGQVLFSIFWQALSSHLWTFPGGNRTSGLCPTDSRRHSQVIWVVSSRTRSLGLAPFSPLQGRGHGNISCSNSLLQRNSLFWLLLPQLWFFCDLEVAVWPTHRPVLSRWSSTLLQNVGGAIDYFVAGLLGFLGCNADRSPILTSYLLLLIPNHSLDLLGPLYILCYNLFNFWLITLGCIFQTTVLRKLKFG